MQTHKLASPGYYNNGVVGRIPQNRKPEGTRVRSGNEKRRFIREEIDGHVFADFVRHNENRACCRVSHTMILHYTDDNCFSLFLSAQAFGAFIRTRVRASDNNVLLRLLAVVVVVVVVMLPTSCSKPERYHAT